MILVTGGTGFVGSHLVEKLRALGEPVRCLVRPVSAARSFPGGVESAVVHWASGRGVEEALRGVHLVFHLAGVTKALSPATYYEGNARATETLVRALQGRPVRLVHVSSLAAIGPSLDGLPVDEDAPPHPVSTYGKSKLEGERIARTLFPDAVIVRPPVVYGPRDTDVFRILKAVAQGLVLEIAGGERWFSAIYVEDLVEGLLAALRGVPGRAYFLAHPQPVSSGQLAPPRPDHGASAACGSRAAPRGGPVGLGAEVWSHITRRPGIISREKVAERAAVGGPADIRRAAAELGFEARTPLAAGLTQTLAWYKEAAWLNT